MLKISSDALLVLMEIEVAESKSDWLWCAVFLMDYESIITRLYSVMLSAAKSVIWAFRFSCMPSYARA